MIRQKKIELKCNLLRKYLEKTQLMHTVIRAGDFEAFESLIADRDEIISADEGETFPDSPEAMALARLIAEEQARVDGAFARFRSDVEKAYNENRKSIRATELGIKADTMYRGSHVGLGSSFDYKK